MLLCFLFLLVTTQSINYDEYQVLNCSNSTFPIDMANMQCFGLTEIKQAKSLQECQQSCCDNETCSIYEWCPNTSTECSPAASCWIGVLPNNCKKADGWIARSKPKTTNYTINTNTDGIGPKYNGLGGLSGGGATSRLLWDYNQKYQTQILDYLFKPYFGASLHILKTEIGGDTFSGCGTESSHQHNATTINYHQGYEWYIMKQAKQRNPSIKGYGLPWGMPAWIGSGALNNNMTQYITNWILGAENVYNFTINYIGIWNEDKWTTDYVKNLRKLLNVNNLQHVKIVVADNSLGSGNTIVQQMNNDNEFANAVGIIGVHYPSGSTSTNNMITCGKTLWASEDDSTSNVHPVGGGCLARIINWNWIIGSYTSTIVWNLLTSYYKYLRWYGDSFMNAAFPYSGFYQVNTPIWVAAHTTQFTYPLDEWHLLKHNNGAGMLSKGGSYVSYFNNITHDISIVIETMNKNNSLCIRSNPGYDWSVKTQNVTFQFKDYSNNNWINKKIYVWKSVLFAENKDDISFFIQQDPIMIDKNGKLNLYNVEPDSLITLTTTTGQKKGSYPAPPNNHPFQDIMPYIDDFSTSIINRTGKYFSDMCGSFAIEPCLDGKNGNCLTQQVWESPSLGNTGWHNQDSKQPITIIGDYSLSNYEVYAECLFNGNGKASNIAIGLNLGGSLSETGCGGNANEPPCVEAYNSNWYNFGYFFQIDIDGTWKLLEGNNLLDQGNYTNIENNDAFTLRFGNNNGILYGMINNKTMFNTLYYTPFSNGWAGLGCGWFDCQFIKFKIESVA